MTSNPRTVAVLLLGVLMPCSAIGQTHRHVSITGDDLGGANTCFDPALPCRTVAQATGTAFSGDIIHIGGGAYAESLVIDRSLTLVGAGESITILQAHAQAGVAAQRVLLATGALELRISDLTIRHGRETSCFGGGGARAESGATLMFERVRIMDNVSECGAGGGVLASGASQLFLDQTTFVGNRAPRGGGAALGSGGVITRSSFVDNEATTSAPEQGGGALVVGSATIRDVIFINNRAASYGGAIATMGGPVIEDSLFSGNEASNGGAFYSDYSHPRMRNVVFEGNVAQSFGGGVLRRGGSIEILSGAFRGNSAAHGGGIAMQGIGIGTSIIDDIVFESNSASLNGGALYVSGTHPALTSIGLKDNVAGEYGAGIYASQSNLVVRDALIEGNTAALRGGGAYLLGGAPTLTEVVVRGNLANEIGGGIAAAEGTPALTNVSFVGNQAALRGGGMDNAGSAAELVNVLFAGNLAGSHGGGLSNRLGSPSTLINVAFVGNRGGGNGGGVHNTSNSPPDVRNALFWNNQDVSGTGTAAASIASSSTSTPVVVSSMLQGCRPGGIWNGDCGANAGGNLADADPRFMVQPEPAHAPFAAGDLRLRADSPVIDMGVNAWVEGVPTDLEGNQRIVGPTVDPGPCEYTPTMFRDTFEALPTAWAACRFAVTPE